MSEVVRPHASRWLGRRALCRVGGVEVSSYVAMLYLGCVAGVFVGAAAGAASGLDPSRFALATILLLIPAFAGARLWFVLEHLESYRRAPARIWRRREGGSALYGGLAVSFVVSVPVLAIADLPFWAFWDAASFTMLTGLIFTRFGCLANGCCTGRPTGGPLGVWLPDVEGDWRRRYPTPLLEAAWAALVLVWALVARPGLPFAGALFAGVVALYGVGRLVLEPTRESAARPRALRANLAFSAALVVAGCAVLAVGFAT